MAAMAAIGALRAPASLLSSSSPTNSTAKAKPSYAGLAFSSSSLTGDRIQSNSALSNRSGHRMAPIVGYKWDRNPKHLKPETGLLQLRSGLKVFANLRPATVLPQMQECRIVPFIKCSGFKAKNGGYVVAVYFWNSRKEWT